MASRGFLRRGRMSWRWECKGPVWEIASFPVLLGGMEGGGGGRWREEQGKVDRTTFLRDLIFWIREFKLSPKATRICHFDVLNGICLPEVMTPTGVIS